MHLLQAQEIGLCNLYVRYGVYQQLVFSSGIMKNQTIKNDTLSGFFTQGNHPHLK